MNMQEHFNRQTFCFLDGIIVLIILSLPFYGIRFIFFDIPINSTEILVIGAFVLMTISGTFSSLQFKREKWLIIGAILMCFGVFIATITGNDMRIGLGVVKGWFVFPMLLGLIIWTRSVQWCSAIHIYLWTYFISAIAVSIIALYYYFSGNLTYDGRLQGFYGSPNYLALYITPAFFFVLFLKDLGFQWRVGISGGLLILVSVLFLTNSFSAWIAIAATLIVTIFTIAKKKALFIVVLMISISIIGLSQINSQKVADLRIMPERSSIASRIMIWESAIMIGRDHALFGITPNTFQQQYIAYQQYFPPYLEWAVPQPHNLYLAFWLQSGVVGLSGFLIVLWWFYDRMYPFIKKNALVAFLVACVTSILFYGLMDTPYWKNDLAFLFWLLIGSSVGVIQHLHRQRYQDDTTGHHNG